VQSPEEIAAITFTKKAAAEMRKRVLEALAQARTEEKPPEPHRALTWKHARAALARDGALGWGLEETTERRLAFRPSTRCCALAYAPDAGARRIARSRRALEDANLLYFA